MLDPTSFLSRTLLENPYWRWLLAVGLSLTLCLAALLVRRWVRARHAQLARTERIELMEIPLDVAGKTTTFALLVGALYVGIETLALPVELTSKLAMFFTVVGFWQVGIWASAAVLAWLVSRRGSSLERDRALAGSLGIISFICQLVVWVIVFLLALDNLGVDITALVAGLGIGGIAVALAVQKVLGDLLASLSITMDKPFVIGDFVIIGEFLGSVEQIGIKSTRIRSLGGEQIVISNADLLGSRIRNYGKMKERRVLFTIGVSYETPRQQLQRIPAIIRRAIEAEPGTRFDRSHFQKYGDFSLLFESVYYMLTPDYNRYMDVQQAVNFAIHEAFEREGIAFAYLTQRPWLSSEKGPASAA